MKWLILIALFSTCAQAAECSVTSGKTRVSLLELYTSEGCSSCPPADKWLSQIESMGFKQEQVVALAFHVDYWDYIGWKDPYARAEFSDRQRRAARLQQSNAVYTPQFMLNGKDFRGWFREKRLQDSIDRISTEAVPVQIELHLSDSQNDRFKLTSTVKKLEAGQKDTDVFIAIYENQLKTSVKAGENQGRQLTHDYVVREWYGPFKLDNSGQTWQQERWIAPNWRERNAGIAAFVQNRNSGEILQAASLKICS